MFSDLAHAPDKSGVARRVIVDAVDELGHPLAMLPGPRSGEDAIRVAVVDFDGGAGEDTARMEGSSAVETFTAYPNSATFSRTGLQVNVEQVEEINAIVLMIGAD